MAATIVAYPNATVTAQISSGNFVCHDVMNGLLPPFVAQSNHPIPGGFN